MFTCLFLINKQSTKLKDRTTVYDTPVVCLIKRWCSSHLYVFLCLHNHTVVALTHWSLFVNNTNKAATIILNVSSGTFIYSYIYHCGPLMAIDDIGTRVYKLIYKLLKIFNLLKILLHLNETIRQNIFLTLIQTEISIIK